MSDLQFRIEASSKAFEILASNLYSDKVSAVIRELSCNAADAHAEAGIPHVPFHVHLPCYPDAYFKIRDFGNGLRADQIEDIFTVFFSSTKVGSKAYTGAFGLGCKSPFAIVNNFHVTSYIDGIKYRYECKRENGIPSIQFIRQEPTKEKNGLEIFVPLQNYNSGEWKNKALAIFEYFKVRPNTNVALDYFSQSPDYKCGDNWENTKEQSAYVVMNNVRYRLDLTKIDKKLYEENGSHLRRRGICYHLPPRSVEPTPSREHLSYTQQTIDFLNEHIKKIHKDFQNKIQEELEGCESKINAQCRLIEIRRNFQEEYFHFDMLMHPLLFDWRGQQITNGRMIEPVIAYTDTIEIGLFLKLSKYSSKVKTKLFTNTALDLSNAELVDAVFLINDTKASQETILSWASKHIKSYNKVNVTFIVVKDEYLFILTEHNKINKDKILYCSNLNLYKISTSNINRSKQAAKNIIIHSFDINTGSIFEKQEAEDNADMLSNMVDSKGNIYFLDYANMSYLGSNGINLFSTNGNWITLAEYGIFVKNLIGNSNIFDKHLNIASDKILLIKNIKKNKLFMKKYAKENNVRFISFATYFQNTLEKYQEENPKYIKYIADEFALCFWSNHGESSFCHSENFLIYKFAVNNEEFYNKMNMFLRQIDAIEKNTNNNELKELCEFIKKHNHSSNYNKIINSIKYLFKIVCCCDILKFEQIISENCGDAFHYAKFMINYWKKIPALFLSEEEKNKKIVEYYLTGKIT